MGIQFSPVGGFNFSSQVSDLFKDSLKFKSNEDLINMLGKDNLSPAARDAISHELESRFKANQAEKSGGGGGDDEDDLQKLLKKLQDGTISADEMKKLAGMLGVSVATLEKIKDKGREETGADITSG
ncbi:hypothetical protein SAMN05518865_106252 [Duganella sp. CF458]|uniref:hypothetical protein n=1 Tax=Duganella sp. CF458 TaxID=1884368 RepID=UPI0008E6D2C0|nr:hypothetical protein [Duganella sp. CF458]SFF95203.1 hypothetical protein SAMN05518865_106252 [Duganella sp. CF458]